jgi:nitronate monooxygenase
MVIEGMKARCGGLYSSLKLPDIRGIALPLSNLRKLKCQEVVFYNLIVNKSNIKYKDQLAVLCAEKVDFIITFRLTGRNH